jgi:galactoside O-acetyltransferase
MAFLSEEAVAALGFARVGRDVRISDKASFYHPERISIAARARIDDFCILSAGRGGIAVGRYVHIACYCSLIGDGCIEMEDFSGLSSRVAVYSSSDDFSGRGLAHPTVPEDLRRVAHAPVVLRRHALVGAGSVILPGVTLGLGSAVGALSLVRDDLEAFWIYAGIPARKLMPRQKDLLALEAEVLRRDGTQAD